MEIPWLAMGREVLVVLLEFLFFISERCQVMHYLTHTHTHTGCYTSTRLVQIYYLTYTYVFHTLTRTLHFTILLHFKAEMV